MHIAIIAGRGIEGAGVTRFMSEFEDYVNGYTPHSKVIVFSIQDKKWPREKAQNIRAKIIKPSQLDNLVKFLNEEFDVVIYNSIPAKKGFTEEYKSDFLEKVVRGVTVPKKFSIQNDHKIHSLGRNANLFEINAEMDGIFTFAKDTVFAKKLKENIPGVESKLMTFKNGMNFEVLEKFRKPINERLKKITYLGRFATFKQPWRLYDFNSYLKDRDFIVELEGIERSIGAINFMFKDLENNKEYNGIRMIDCTNPKKSCYVPKEKQTPGLPYVYGPYNRFEALESLSHSLFNCNFFNMKESFGDLLEYATLEGIAIGTIPVLDYDFGVKSGLIDVENFGLFLKEDLSNAEEIADRMEEIWNNLSLRQKYLDVSRDTAEWFCSQNAFGEMLEKIKEKL